MGQASWPVLRQSVTAHEAFVTRRTGQEARPTPKTFGDSVPRFGKPLGYLLLRHFKLANAQGIDFLKMNIEGAERQALPGCEGALRRARFVCIAAHDFRSARGEGEEFRTLDFVKQFVAGAGFEIVMRDDPRYYVPYHVHGVRAPA